MERESSGHRQVWRLAFSTTKSGDFAVENSGEYALYSIAEDNVGNCISEKSDNITVDWGSGIININQYGIHLYPNPAKGMVTVHIPDPNIKQIFIRDLTGRLVLVEDIVSGIENVQIDISSLHSESHYIVEVSSTRIKLIVK